MRRVLWVQREPQVLRVLLARQVLLAQPELSGLLALASRVLPAQTQPYPARQEPSALLVLVLPAHKARLALRVPLLA